MKEFISAEDLKEFDKDFHEGRSNLIAMNAVTSNGVNKAAKRWQSPSNGVHEYSIMLDQHGVTNQKHSGRCWMFAALNVLRFKVIHSLNLDTFEFSENYTFFYDKLEKANYFLESILETLDEKTDSRLIMHLLQSPVQDGGQWDMISQIIEKYGVVPLNVMPESACSSESRQMDEMLTRRLRTDAMLLRNAYAGGSDIEALRNMKDEMLNVIYRMLCICLGTPPKSFDFKLRTKDEKYICDCGLTPKEFFDKYVDFDLHNYISLINAPTADKPYMRSYTIKFLGNVVGARGVRYVNVPIEVLKDAAIAQLKAGEPVWFGCDVGKFSDREGGAMDLEAYDYEGLFDTDFPMNKAQRLDYGASQMTHAMVFEGVDLDQDGRPIRWRVENSWGDESGKKGMYVMTDRWFDEYMYQVVVNKKYLPSNVIDAYESTPIELSPWDPMGSLA